MKKRWAVLAVYAVVGVLCAALAGNMYYNGSSEYEAAIEQISYQLGYPRLYSRQFSPHAEDVQQAVASGDILEEDMREKTVYLTFDDGPSPRTGEILDILKKNDVKATFFIVGDERYTEYMKRAAREGHTLGVHSASHKYNEIYKSVDAYLQDFEECYKYIYENTGVKPEIFRFPGGSVNNYNVKTRKDIVREMTRRGFVYFDWNVESSDSSGRLSARTIYNNVLNGCKGKSRAVVIMHDAADKKGTVQALDDIICALKEDGWTFAALSAEVRPVIFRMK